MCGIFGYVGSKKNAAQMVLDGLKSLEYRGYDSWGVAAVPEYSQKTKDESRKTETGSLETKNERRKSGKPESRVKESGSQTIIVKKKTGKIGEATVADMPASSFAFGHTRWATHGGVTEENAHPHLDCTKTISVIHNGIIENYAELKKKLVKKGHTFTSETDTEVAAHLIEEYTKKLMFSKAVQKAFNEMEGLNAIIAIHSGERQFVAARNGSPLVIGFGVKENYLASDAAAILPFTKQVHFLEDGEMAIISEHGVALFNAKTGDNIHPKKQTLTWTLSQVEKGDFPYFMLKEIHEQPGIITDIAADSSTYSEKVAGIIKKSFGGYLIGCGSASYACLAGTYLFSTIARHHMNYAVASEFPYALDFLTPKSLVIALSQSGETMDLIEAIKKSKAKGAKILSLVNVLGSTLYRQSDYKLLLSAGPEKSVCSTKAFIAKLAHLTLLSYAMAGKAEEGKKVLLSAAHATQNVLSKQSTKAIEKLAKTIAKKDHAFVIGRGLSYPASLEAAMKIKEITYIHAEGFAAGELKHGVIALIEKGTPCIVFLPNDETYQATLAGAMEMKARGGHIIGISFRENSIFDDYIHVDDAGVATIMPNVVVAQLLAYYTAIEKNLDPDKPRNLAKSVTVK